ncbi:hypothetical protein GIB67_004146 [Kingdonia uniflora]|uniref:CRAL-TRIO domain-containing protein n=1 Tax=Kingdonia uniflora TaxID=39325 RepID=A0A7J7NS08_9MAGN|nr:hypothetical protein GIB67_004146 [Kingdonia uniflora]
MESREHPVVEVIETREDNMNIINEVEHKKVELMRTLVEKQDPTSKTNHNLCTWSLSVQEADDFMIRRFLRARDLDVEKASTLFLKYLKWRRTFMPKGFIPASDIPNELSQKKMFLQGFDKKGRPISVAFGGRHVPSKDKGGLDEFKRTLYSVQSRENMCEVINYLSVIKLYLMPNGQEKFVGIADCEGWGFSNCDIHGFVGGLHILQDCYPERLGKMFIVHAPYVFMAAWKIIYPFIDSNTKKKLTLRYHIYHVSVQIVFVENKKLKSTFLEDIDESQLPEIYGGKLPLVPLQDC